MLCLEERSPRDYGTDVRIGVLMFCRRQLTGESKRVADVDRGEFLTHRTGNGSQHDRYRTFSHCFRSARCVHLRAGEDQATFHPSLAMVASGSARGFSVIEHTTYQGTESYVKGLTTR